MTISRVVLLIGVFTILLSAFGVALGPMDLFKFGVGVAFASMLL